MERIASGGVGASVITLLVVCGAFAAALVVYVALGLAGRRPRSEEMSTRGDTMLLPLYVREYWDWVIGPGTRALIKAKANPTMITWASFFVAAMAGAAFSIGYFGLGGWLYILAGTLDMFDGKVARATGSVSKAGAFIDSTLDRYTEVFVLGGLAYFFRETPVLWAAIAGIVGSLMVSYTRARGEGLGYSCREGGVQRAERIVYIGLSGVFGKVAEAFRPEGRWSVALMAAALTWLALSTNWTAVRRFFSIVQALRAQERAIRNEEVVRHPALRTHGR